MDQEEEDLAVKMALAETQVIKETKEWLSLNGVDVQIFDNTTRKDCQRSRKVILVKNLPYEITQQKLKEIFAYYGHVTKILLPQTRALGVVSFESAQHA